MFLPRPALQVEEQWSIYRRVLHAYGAEIGRVSLWLDFSSSVSLLALLLFQFGGYGDFSTRNRKLPLPKFETML